MDEAKATIVYLDNERTINLQRRIDAFAAKVVKDYTGLAQQVLRSNRNTMISRMWEVMSLHNCDEQTRQLQNDIMTFFAGDAWIVGVSAYVQNHPLILKPAPHRHCDLQKEINLWYERHLEIIRQEGEGSASTCPQEGFVVYQCGAIAHADRRNSLLIAYRNGQLRRRAGSNYYHGEELYSEDLW